MTESAISFERCSTSIIKTALGFALVAIAIVGLVEETRDVNTDTPRGVLLVAGAAAIGCVTSIIYTRLEKDPARVRRVQLAVWTMLRFFLAFEMTRYGVAKIVGMQVYPRDSQLDTRAIDLKPMALAWTFFGRTYGYQAVSGVLEVAASILLCFRRTTTLAACILLAVLSNVVLVDFFYDVPVRLFSSVYLAMTLYVLLAMDASRFAAFFLGIGSVPARAYLTTKTRPYALMHAIAFAIVVGVPSADIVRKASQRRVFEREPMEGIWKVEAKTTSAWDRVYVEKGGYGFVLVGNDRIRVAATILGNGDELKLDDFVDHPEAHARGSLASGRLHLDGVFNDAPLSIDLKHAYP